MEFSRKNSITSLTLAVFCAAAIFGIASGLSFENSKEGREKYYNFMVESHAQGKNYDGTELKEKCKDRLPAATCSSYKPLCSYYKIIREICAETCEQCRRASTHPFPCEATKFGCCWDNYTKALGAKQEGCPACVDMANDCKYLKDRCPERAEVRRICPVTCGVPCQRCEDDPHQAAYCPFFQMAGFCERDPKLMKKNCKKTCGFCIQSQPKATCEDDRKQAGVCFMYKKAGLCKIDPALMKKDCKKTCGFCS